MSAHKSIDKICIVIVALTLVVAFIFCNGQALGVETTAHAIGYENRLFDHSKVHSLDIVINDWDSFLETCENEEYTSCNIIIDGESIRDVGIRAKGNTSLSSVKNMNSNRYSFKIEFDQYDDTKSYHGLDKLCLNNIIQDNTYMKDYLAYTLMYDFGVDAPLCSYAYITVNGEDWGLYLAVEAIEESFLQRNYGSNYGDLYKPDSMSFGGGRGNGRDFSMSDFMDENSDDSSGEKESDNTNRKNDRSSNGFDPSKNFEGKPDFSNGEMPSDFDFSNLDPSQGFGGNFDPNNMPEGFDPSQGFGGEIPSDFDPDNLPEGFNPSNIGEGKGGFGGFGGGFGMGSDDVKLKYIDDDASSYSNIFGNAKTIVNTADQNRLIHSLKALTEQSDLENTVDVEEVIRYFVVHNFLCNGDSYTGQMIHNYYLYEENGQLSMIPWDYNLAYGSFMGGNASSSVNSAIDTPVSGDMSDRPMISWIFDNEEYTEQYHQLFNKFLDSIDFEKLISDTAELIDEYVEKDPTKFCTYEEFKKGVEAISKFCQLREESVNGQLNGSIPSNSSDQSANSSSLIDTSDLNISDMGSMGGGFGGGGQRSDFGNRTRKSDNTDDSKKTERSNDKISIGTSEQSVRTLSNFTISETDSQNNAPNGRGGRPPQGFGGDFDPDNMPEGFDPSQGFGGDFDPNNMPEGFDPSQGFGGEMPSDFDPDNLPEGFDPNNIPDGFGKTTTSADKSVSTTTTDSSSKNEQKTTTAVTKDSSRESRPQMGSFPGMGGASKQKDPMVLVLLGASALILLAGLGFAFKFKR